MSRTNDEPKHRIYEQKELARRNFTAISVFYGFIFIFVGSLSTLSIYIAENEPTLSLAMYFYVLLIGIVQAAIGWAIYVESKKADITELARYGLIAFISIMPGFYIAILGGILSLPDMVDIVGFAIYVVALFIVGYFAGTRTPD
ncbi:MAG: hypothetical protein GF309_13440 [Candidatus Lokiarchaeota archaeon]|nr:hypothetical protein [Candidatus Lokiarchaeota archaeon]